MSCVLPNCCLRLFRTASHRSPHGSVQNEITVISSNVTVELGLAAEEGTTEPIDTTLFDTFTEDSGVIYNVEDSMGSLTSNVNDPSALGTQQADIAAISQDPPIDSAQRNPAGAETEGISEVYHETSQGGEAQTNELAVLREKCRRFRILVLGRANAGKTTLLRAVCGTKGDPQILTKTRRGEQRDPAVNEFHPKK